MRRYAHSLGGVFLLVCSGLAARVPEGCSSVQGRSSGSRGRWQGLRRGSWIVKAGVLHAQPSWLGSHTIGHLEEQKMSPVVYSSCLLLSQRHSQLQDPLLSGDRWGPHQSLGLLYGPSSYQRWRNLWQTLFLRDVLMTHTPGNGLGPTRHESCSFRSLCSRHTHGRKCFLDVYPCQPWPKCRAKQVCTLTVHSEWMACLCKKELKLDLSTFPVLQMCLCDHLVISGSSQWSKGVLLGVSGSMQINGGEPLEEVSCC